MLGLILNLLKFLLFGLELDLLLHFEDLTLSAELEFLSLKFIVHFIISNPLKILCLRFLLLIFELFLEKLCLLLLFHESSLGRILGPQFVHGGLSNECFFVDGLVGICGNSFGFLSA